MRLFNGATVTETVTVGSTVTVNVKNFATAFNPPAYPDPTSAVQIANRPNWVRYVRLTATTANILAWREIFVFDSTNTNVVKAKRCYSNVGCYSATNCCDKTVDHIIDTEATDPMCVCRHSARRPRQRCCIACAACAHPPPLSFPPRRRYARAG